MNRRIFLQWASLGWLVSFLQSCLAGGGTGQSTAPAAASPVALGSAASLDQAGFLLNEKTALGPVLVIKDPADATRLKAVNPTCTHKGCIVGWQAQEQQFVCPCHDARFGPDGSALPGPASEALGTYEARIENGEVVVGS